MFFVVKKINKNMPIQGICLCLYVYYLYTSNYVSILIVDCIEYIPINQLQYFVKSPIYRPLTNHTLN